MPLTGHKSRQGTAALERKGQRMEQDGFSSPRGHREDSFDDFQTQEKTTATEWTDS